MKTILDLTYSKAKGYFLESQNYCNVQFPVYINFQPVLNYVKNKVGNNDFDTILKDKKQKPSDFENVNYQILFKKDENYTYRPIQLINPFLYYLLVNELTTENHWKEIKDRFAELSVPNIEVQSIPKVNESKYKSHNAANVSSWWENFEQRCLELALSYRYMFVTDITNCYGSIYTHSIAWAMMGRDKAKRDRQKSSLLGNIIDRYIRGMQNAQTNGIPQGSVLSDFIAEIVLAYADKELDDKIHASDISDYRIIRYRDDYRIFANSREDIEKIAFLLQGVLSELNFQLNIKKTNLTEEIVSESLKPDKRAYLSETPLYRTMGKRTYSIMSSLQQEAFFIHQISKKYPNSGTLVKLLTTFCARLGKKSVVSYNIHVLISIITDTALLSPKTYKIALAILSILINKIPKADIRERVVKDIYNKFQRFPNIGEIQIWMQRITYKLPNPIVYSEGLCKIVNNEDGVELWNNDWVADSYKTSFPQSQICTDWIRTKYTPIIDVDEVSLFDIY